MFSRSMSTRSADLGLLAVECLSYLSIDRFRPVVRFFKNKTQCFMPMTVF